MRRYVLGNVQSEYVFINDMGFWGRYCIDTTLLVIIHISRTQKWAAQCNAPLRSGIHTMMDEIINSISLIRDKYYNVRKNV